jgi:O-methyltransferase involved in polyketide biosynthesis
MEGETMSEKIAVDLGNVQKTMFLPMWARAFESKKANPLLVDKTALQIIEKVDYDFSTAAQNLSELTQMAWILRSLGVDETIKKFLQKCPKATIVNIGCGMDTTFDRIDNGSLLWYDLDLPDVIQLRKQFIQETERRKFITSSFLEHAWLKEITVAGNVLFIAAGVFYYFEESQIKDFLIRLADSFPGSEIFFDVSSPYGIKVANKMVIKNSGLDEKSFLTWGLKNAQELAAWDERFKVLRTYYYFRDKGKYLQPKTRLIGFISDAMNIQYMIHLGLGNKKEG